MKKINNNNKRQFVAKKNKLWVRDEELGTFVSFVSETFASIELYMNDYYVGLIDLLIDGAFLFNYKHFSYEITNGRLKLFLSEEGR